MIQNNISMNYNNDIQINSIYRYDTKYIMMMI